MTKRLVDPRSGSIVVVDDEMAKKLSSSYIDAEDWDNSALSGAGADNDEALQAAKAEADEAKQELEEVRAELEALKAAHPVEPVTETPAEAKPEAKAPAKGTSTTKK